MSPCYILLITEGLGKYIKANQLFLLKSMDIPDPLSPLLPIVHHFWQVLKGHIPFPHRAGVCRFELVALLLFGHVRGHRRQSLMSSSLLLQQCPACLVCLTFIVFVMGGIYIYIYI